MKRLFFGLLIAGIAFGGSAFTNAKHVNSHKGMKTISADLLAYSSSSDAYFPADDGGSCLANTSDICHYSVNPSNGIPARPAGSTYTKAEVTSYLNSGWLNTATGTGNYTP